MEKIGNVKFYCQEVIRYPCAFCSFLAIVAQGKPLSFLRCALLCDVCDDGLTML